MGTGGDVTILAAWRKWQSSIPPRPLPPPMPKGDHSGCWTTSWLRPAGRQRSGANGPSGFPAAQTRCSGWPTSQQCMDATITPYHPWSVCIGIWCRSTSMSNLPATREVASDSRPLVRWSIRRGTKEALLCSSLGGWVRRRGRALRWCGTRG